MNPNKIEDIFKVVKDENNNYIYFSLNLENTPLMVDDIFEFFFSEKTIYEHFKYQYDYPFLNNPQNNSFVFRNLRKFIDSEIEEEKYSFDDYSQEIISAVKEDVQFFKDHKIRYDKSGKIGEYLLSIILEKYFSLKCVLPKMNMTTNRNMSVFGIDTLHYSETDDSILFGESKFTTSLDNGITLLTESLKKYDEMLTNEIELIFTQDKINQLNLPKKYKNAIECFVDVPTFIKDVGVKTIVIPAFIAHGKTLEENEIFEKLSKLPKTNKLGLKTFYFFMSMPIKDVDIFLQRLTLKIKDKEDELRRRVRS